MSRGAPMKYATAEELERAVDAYFASISYQEPAVVATPTGEVDEKGQIKWKTRMLTEVGQTPGIGKPITVTRWLKPPNVAGLCLHLGIVRDTWWRYEKKPEFKPVTERARMRMEDYWAGMLETKANKGAAFALENNYGWKGEWRSRQEVGLDPDTRKAVSVESFLRKEARKDGGDYEY